MISQSAILHRTPDVRFRAVEDETVVIRQEAAEALVINEVAGRILELIDGERTVEDVVAQLHNEYEVRIETLRSDVLAYVEELLETGLVRKEIASGQK